MNTVWPQSDPSTASNVPCWSKPACIIVIIALSSLWYLLHMCSFLLQSRLRAAGLSAWREETQCSRDAAVRRFQRCHFARLALPEARPRWTVRRCKFRDISWKETNSLLRWQLSRGLLLLDFGSLDILPVWNHTKQRGKTHPPNSSTGWDQHKQSIGVKTPWNTASRTDEALRKAHGFEAPNTLEERT